MVQPPVAASCTNMVTAAGSDAADGMPRGEDAQSGTCSVSGKGCADCMSPDTTASGVSLPLSLSSTAESGMGARSQRGLCIEVASESGVPVLAGSDSDATDAQTVPVHGPEPSIDEVTPDMAASRHMPAPASSYNVNSGGELSAKSRMQASKQWWTAEEDSTLHRLVGLYGPCRWSQISKSLPGRQGKQCRERWHQHLAPEVRKGGFSVEEDRMILEAVALHGKKWSEIVKMIPGRTDNAIKNRWNSATRKLLRMHRRRDSQEMKPDEVDLTELSASDLARYLLETTPSPREQRGKRKLSMPASSDAEGSSASVSSTSTGVQRILPPPRCKKIDPQPGLELLSKMASKAGKAAAGKGRVKGKKVEDAAATILKLGDEDQDNAAPASLLLGLCEKDSQFLVQDSSADALLSLSSGLTE